MSFITLFARKFTTVSRNLSPTSSGITRYMGGIPAKTTPQFTTRRGEEPKVAESKEPKEFSNEEDFEVEWKRHTFSDYKGGVLSDEDLVASAELPPITTPGKFRGPPAHPE
ncbi:hypothetical protein HDU93_006038 [Gonapodya sp. JEL0774]|nr:hypothetical protein HDU93_006038 [Gonapodya sp. JEL0774]